jgi:hypothetical protein
MTSFGSAQHLDPHPPEISVRSGRCIRVQRDLVQLCADAFAEKARSIRSVLSGGANCWNQGGYWQAEAQQEFDLRPRGSIWRDHRRHLTGAEDAACCLDKRKQGSDRTACLACDFDG